MNKDRRQKIEALKERIESLKTMAEEIQADAQTIRDDEQEYFDNMPESLQGGDKGQKAEAAISQLDDVIDDLQSLIDCDFDGRLDTAAE